MYDYLYYDDWPPDSLSPVSVEEVPASGKKYKVYLYRITYKDNDSTKSFLTAHGGYLGNRLEPRYSFSIAYRDESYLEDKKEEYYEQVALDFLSQIAFP